MRKVEEVYPITTIDYPDGSQMQTVQFKHMDQYTAPISLEAFKHWMGGQTVCEDGYYLGDVERWLNNQKVVD